jgi:hypothetical protein
MKAFWDRVIAMRQKGICEVEIDEILVEPLLVEECEVTID